MSVSIITRTKNRPLFLARAIKSVTTQTYTEWQHIIVNDAGNKEIVENIVFKNYPPELKEKVTILHNELSLGMEAASNKGLTAATGTYVAIHDDDDTWEKDFLQETVTFLEKNKSYAGVITYTNKIEEEITTNEILLKNRHLFNNISQLSFECIFRTNLFPPIAFIYKRDVFSVIGTYDESFLVLGDWDFNLRFLKKYTIGIIPLPLANYHIRLTQKNMSAGNSIGAGKSLHLNHVEKINYKYFIPDLQQGAPSFCIILQSVLRNVPGFSLTDFLDMLLWCENHTTVPRSVFLSIFLKEGFQSPLCLKDKLKLSIALILGTVWIDRIHAFIHLPKYPPLQHTP